MTEEEHTCAECGKKAIGIQAIGCCTAYVCEEHAHSILRNLKTGEKYSTTECYFERFGEAGH